MKLIVVFCVFLLLKTAKLQEFFNAMCNGTYITDRNLIDKILHRNTTTAYFSLENHEPAPDNLYNGCVFIKFDTNKKTYHYNNLYHSNGRYDAHKKVTVTLNGTLNITENGVVVLEAPQQKLSGNFRDHISVSGKAVLIIKDFGPSHDNIEWFILCQFVQETLRSVTINYLMPQGNDSRARICQNYTDPNESDLFSKYDLPKEKFYTFKPTKECVDFCFKNNLAVKAFLKMPLMFFAFIHCVITVFLTE